MQYNIASLHSIMISINLKEMPFFGNGMCIGVKSKCGCRLVRGEI